MKPFFHPLPLLLILTLGSASLFLHAQEAAKSDQKTPSNEESPATDASLEAIISRHITNLADEERKTRMKFMQIVIDDVARICQLDQAQKDRLSLAASGAVERSMKEWHVQAERYFRSRLEKSDPDEIKEKLESMGSMNFGSNRSEEEGESNDLWRDALKDVLSEEQIGQYEATLKRREDDRNDAFARLSLSMLDELLRLTPEQRTKLSEIVTSAVQENLREVRRYWGEYFEQGMFLSFANFAEAETLQSILTESQFNQLRDATGSFEHFWDQKRRLRRAMDKAAQNRKEKAEKAAKNGDGPGDVPKALKIDDQPKEGNAGALRMPGPGVRIKVD